MNKASFSILLIAAAAVIFGLTGPGCRSSEKKETTDSTAYRDSVNRAKTDDSTARVSEVDGERIIRTVRMTRRDFMNAFQSASNDDNIRIMYLKWRNMRNGDYSLSIYGALSDGERSTGDFDLDTVAGGRTLSFNPSDHYYEQQLTRGNFKAFLGETTVVRGPIDENRFPDEVWLTPCTRRDENGDLLIYFRVTEPANATDCPQEVPLNERGLMSSNPSPPGHPCESQCDELMFKKMTKKDILNYVKDGKNTN